MARQLLGLGPTTKEIDNRRFEDERLRNHIYEDGLTILTSSVILVVTNPCHSDSNNVNCNRICICYE